MRFLEITGRKCHIYRNRIYLVMEPSIDNGKEQVTLSLAAIQLLLPFFQQVAFDKFAHLVDLGKANFHFAVNFVDTATANAIVRSVLQEGLPSISQLVFVIVTVCDNSQWLNYLL